MKLVHQLPLALGAALLAASAAGVFGIAEMNSAADAYARLIGVDGAQARQVSEAMVAFKNPVQNGKDIVLRGDTAVGDLAMDGLDREPVILLRVTGARIVEQTAAAAARAKSLQRRAMLASVVAMTLTVLAGIGGAVAFSRTITRKLGGEPDDARAAAREIATGKLDIDLYGLYGAG